MIKATHPNAGYFTEYIYSIYGTEGSNILDVLLQPQCNDKSEEGFHCENCYRSQLHDKLYFCRTPIEMKKFLTYQLGLYNDPEKWVVELKQCMKYDTSFQFSYQIESLIEDTLSEIIEIDSPKSDLDSFIQITNIFEGATIQQLNMRDGVQTIHYNDTLDRMLSDGVPREIIEEGREYLKDADKSDSLKKISGNWIKSLPFKVMEKAGEWAIKNTDKLAEYQEELMKWISTLTP
ncbi:MAG: hypothetical protein Crog4KO_00390 [Crocinitomicaceae bacterium]